MKRIWGFGREKGMSPLGSASGLQRQGRGVGQKNNRIDNLLLGYHVQDRDLRKIHKAACVGNAAQVQQILFMGENGVDDRDKMNRTALHLACANGHPEVVSLLVERKCHLNLCDHENRTALMKAVQCQEEKCVNILLENGADPNIRDVSGNTALHYAAFGDNISIIEKLLLYNANTEARNKDNITPLLVAVNENKQQIVEVLVEKAANTHAEDKLKSNYEIICRHKEEIMLKNSLQNSNPGSDEKAEEDSITRLSDKPGPDDSWPTSSSQVLHFGTKVEEKKKHRGSDMEVSENIHDAAAAGLIPQRQNGKTDNHQLPITENKDSDRREPGLHMKKLKKGENEKGTLKGSVITPVLQKADSLTGGPLQKNDGSHFSEKDQHESRPAKKISKKKNKVKKQITSMDDLVDFIQSSETASEHCELPYSKNFMLLIEQLGMDCKDYAGFLKIRDIRVSYEKLRKLNKNHCKLLTGKMTEMDKVVSALQSELREAKDMISRLEHQKVEWEREFCSLRCTLKQEEEEERRNADILYENIREKLRRKEDEYKKEVETKQQVELALRMLNTELKATKNQVVEEHSDTQWQLSPEQKARVLQDGSLNNHFCKQKELEMAQKKTNSKVAARQLQQELADTLKKQSMSEASPEVTSYLRLEGETRDLKKKLAQIRSQADVLTTELETTSSKCLHLDAKNQVLQQELLSVEAFEEEREKLESNNKKLQQEVVKLKQFMEMNMVERSQVEQYKREIEERARLDIVEKLHEVNLFLQAQAAAQENLDQLRENAHASTRSQMELRIKDLESQLSTMKMSQEDSTKTELETYRQLYLEELKLRKSLRNKLNRTNERLSESNTKLLVETQQHQTLLRTLTMSPGLEPPYCGHFENNLVLNGNLTPRGNLVIPTLNPRPSYDDRETSLWKTQRELEKRITRALEEAATEFE
ncbi:ankyrin repeat domain-containing protein 26-like isoform X4 [Panthera pardus]|uniref:Ankyrin repeat domain-containing protein 26-like isoform X4 n=1 Tax=Panthera pardus TaxID=9691 RepID=A0A9W2VW67_PANPR|nr:ankyrin repeat domain-containing protein 26-like isoform X4 [Panthera pardus]